MTMSDLDPDELEDAPVIAAEAEAADAGGKEVAAEFAIRIQPGVVLLNAEDQTPYSITSRKTGQVVSYGRKVAERELPGLQMTLTCDEENGLFWILIVVEEAREMFQNGYLLEHAEGAFRIFIGGTEAQIRANLLIDPPPAS